MDTSTVVRILVADPEPLFRYGLKRLLGDTDHLRVVGEADDAAQVEQEVRRCQADLLIVNHGIRGGGLNGLKGLAAPIPIRCIVVTNGHQNYAQIASRDIMVAGVLPRTSPGWAFISCIEEVVRNPRSKKTEAALNAALAQSQTPYGLTRREAEIVRHVAGCASNKDIAAQLSITEDTVKHHLSNIFNKVGVESRTELAVFALSHGIAQWS
jgi:two-component system, NarL family, nitrate/nitrite response regulator NarL